MVVSSFFAPVHFCYCYIVILLDVRFEHTKKTHKKCIYMHILMHIRACRNGYGCIRPRIRPAP